MDEGQTITELERLLALYPGVTVLYVRRLTGAVQLVLRVTNLESLAQLVRSANGANVPTSIWNGGPGQLEVAQADPADLRFAFLAYDAPSRAEPPSPLEVFDIRLVWDLFANGALNRDAANRLLDSWNGVPI